MEIGDENGTLSDSFTCLLSHEVGSSTLYRCGAGEWAASAGGKPGSSGKGAVKTGFSPCHLLSRDLWFPLASSGSLLLVSPSVDRLRSFPPHSSRLCHLSIHLDHPWPLHPNSTDLSVHFSSFSVAFSWHILGYAPEGRHLMEPVYPFTTGCMVGDRAPHLVVTLRPHG